jgi:AraC-like DNA-binding protein
VLFDYNTEADAVELRHFAIKCSSQNVSDPIREIIESKDLPNLHDLQDISQVLNMAR